jgi:hypothetical protein
MDAMNIARGCLIRIEDTRGREPFTLVSVSRS